MIGEEMMTEVVEMTEKMIVENEKNQSRDQDPLLVYKNILYKNSLFKYLSSSSKNTSTGRRWWFFRPWWSSKVKHEKIGQYRRSRVYAW